MELCSSQMRQITINKIYNIVYQTIVNTKKKNLTQEMGTGNAMGHGEVRVQFEQSKQSYYLGEKHFRQLKQQRQKP